MNDRESDAQTVRQVADVVQSGLPLAAGLRALGEEAPSPRMRRFFTSASKRLEGGDSLETVFAGAGGGVPAPLLRLLRIGAESKRVGLVLEEYLANSRQAIDQRRKAMVALLYPAVLLLASIGIFTFLAIELIPYCSDIYADLGIAVPIATQVLVSASEAWVKFGLWIVLGLLVFVAVVWLSLRLVGGGPFVRRLVCTIPLLGAVLRCSALSGFCRMLALLIENDVPLSEAIRLAGGSCRDPDLELASNQLSQNLERGVSLRKAAVTIRQFPPTLLQVFRWEDKRDALIDALRAASEVFEARSRVAGHTLITVLEPITIMGIACSIGAIVFLLFMPILTTSGAFF